MSIRPIVFALLALTAPALAAASPPPVKPAPMVSAPKATGAPHTCAPNQYYPAKQWREHVEGGTKLSLTVAADGTVKDAAVAETSGDAGLDQAAVSCASTWNYAPAMQNGAAIAVPWQVKVEWLIGDPVRQASGALIVPKNAGAAHVCDIFPNAPMSDGTTVVFDINPDGGVSGASVKTSSGNADYDTAAVACVAAWRFAPPVVDGKPATLAWRALVIPPGPLSTLPKDMTSPVADGPPHICPNGQYYPTAEIRAGIEGTTQIKFRIGTDGRIKDLAVAVSSGDAGLDQASIDCATSWRYVPATQNGQPVEVEWKARINWSLHGGYAPPAPLVPYTINSPVTAGGILACTDKRRNEGASHVPGTAIVSFLIAKDGSVQRTEIRHSSGDAVFDAYAVSCVSGWRYKPVMTLGGQNVEYSWSASIPWPQ
jgi:TonB family protein